MKEYKTILFFCIMLSAIIGNAQSYVYLNDTAFLDLNGYKFGQIQWQESTDSINWDDIPGITGNGAGIVPSVSKYYRAKISGNNCDTFYSDIIKIDVIEFHCGDTLIDYRDCKKYPTVLIGSQCWMAKNLDVGIQINNGTQIPANNSTIEKYCYDNDPANCIINGGLYTWDEMMNYSTNESSRGICPAGWHVPSDYEWVICEISLGMDSTTAMQENIWRGSNEGTKLKAGGSSGYNALLSGGAMPGGTFTVLNEYEYMHSSSEFFNNGWRRCLRTGDETVGRWNTFPKTFGLSVRCVKNN